MGIKSSKFSAGGALKGAFAPPLPGVPLPAKMDPEIKKYSVTVPADKGPGDRMVVNIKGLDVKITIPNKLVLDGVSRPIRSGDKFMFEWGNYQRVIASTLPSLPGTTVVEAKPVIYATVSHAFFRMNAFNDQKEQTSMSKKVGELMQEAQKSLLQRAVEQGCNSVLSINCNVSTDSSGENGNSKIVIVTLVGTPCVVMPLHHLPVVEAEATLVPEMTY